MTLFTSALLIFFLRLADQSLCTMRNLLVNKGKSIYASLIGLVESAIWIIAVSQVIKDLDDPILIIGYASGFSAGTILGSYIEKIMGIGNVVVRVFASENSVDLAPILREAGFPVTVINGEGRDGYIKIYWCIISRRKLNTILHIIKENNPNAYITTEVVQPTSLKK